MNILFVCSGNHGKIHHGTHEQIHSIKSKGIEVDIFLVKGKGMFGHIKNFFPLRRKVKSSTFNLIHAIGGHSALLCVLALFNKKKVVSYLGSDIQKIKGLEKTKKFFEKFLRKIIVLTSKNYIQVIIKARKMLEHLPKSVLNKSNVIPNGVDFDVFRPINMAQARIELNLNQDIKYVLFLGNKELKNKNYQLIDDAYKFIDNDKVEVIKPFPVGHSLIPFYLNAVNVLVLSSFSEGSPNIIKEAMACNCPIVSTDVGDVRENFQNIEGYEISSYDPNDMARKIEKLLIWGKRTNAREKIGHLNKYKISERILEVYKNAIQKSED